MLHTWSAVRHVKVGLLFEILRSIFIYCLRKFTNFIIGLLSLICVRIWTFSFSLGGGVVFVLILFAGTMCLCFMCVGLWAYAPKSTVASTTQSRYNIGLKPYRPAAVSSEGPLATVLLSCLFITFRRLC